MSMHSVKKQYSELFEHYNRVTRRETYKQIRQVFDESDGCVTFYRKLNVKHEFVIRDAYEDILIFLKDKFGVYDDYTQEHYYRFYYVTHEGTKKMGNIILHLIRYCRKYFENKSQTSSEEIPIHVIRFFNYLSTMEKQWESTKEKYDSEYKNMKDGAEKYLKVLASPTPDVITTNIVERAMGHVKSLFV